MELTIRLQGPLVEILRIVRPLFPLGLEKFRLAIVIVEYPFILEAITILKDNTLYSL